jgi:hypothetical protein
LPHYLSVISVLLPQNPPVLHERRVEVVAANSASFHQKHFCYNRRAKIKSRQPHKSLTAPLSLLVRHPLRNCNYLIF